MMGLLSDSAAMYSSASLLSLTKSMGSTLSDSNQQLGGLLAAGSADKTYRVRAHEAVRLCHET